MRFYDIQVGDQRYTSLGSNGWANPGALNIELNIEAVNADVPGDGAFVRIWGIGLSAIAQANQLVGQPITVMAGMSTGLPLARPEQAGVLVKGTVYRAFGNWIGVDQTLDLIISVYADPPMKAGPNPAPTSKNIVMNWKKDQPLAPAIEQALNTAYPNFTTNVQISPNLKAPSDQVGFVGDIKQFADYIRRYTQMLNPDSVGVGITNRADGTIYVSDETRQEQAGVIHLYDLIGQPTWIDYNIMQIKTVMRGDIKVHQKITLPQTLVTNTAAGGLDVAGATAPQQSLSFQGDFNVSRVRSIGNFRQPDAASWVTVIDAYCDSR